MYSRKISRKLNNFESSSPRNSRVSNKRNSKSEDENDSISGSDSYFDSDESLSEDDEREVIALQVAWLTGDSDSAPSSSPRTRADHGRGGRVL